ncbi:paired small multidrug resistance pump [Thermosporothrix hazakensis]|jgi:paired small multidrug resistance pump|uniref:Paired small multidrug resistance pump n=2 Tax=Thermosporothrix TaxID=768650 RepID=A0A326U5Z9_THEHA|nr:multidrug efflux SMR transporter [Thermosporothrix hazakensis]PZW27980.1 paired small multidrug resistance pump [Thermosporothrix hazakensis]BBH86911.1 multidrug resistance protein SMR [Thermosporothrix sp. COM3]GCE51203.1 multidrug resistance protein SMR [Thermosporothrix hazakensis]
MSKAWWCLFIGGPLEVIWVSGIKYATSWWHWLITVAFILFSFKLFFEAAEKLPLGTVYTVFTGIGTAGTVITEILFFGEAINPFKLFLIATLTGGIIGLKMLTSERKEGQA